MLLLTDGSVLAQGMGTNQWYRLAIYDPATNAWTAAADKISSVGEEGASVTAGPT